jgi:cytochrome c oxidase subunit 2
MKKLLTLALAVILAGSLSACSSKDSAAPVDETNAKIVTIKAKDFSFDQQEYKVKKGDKIKFVFENEKGNHGARISDLGVSLSASKKSQVVMIDKTGEFEIRCSIMCGAGHNNMIAKVVAE